MSSSAPGRADVIASDARKTAPGKEASSEAREILFAAAVAGAATCVFYAYALAVGSLYAGFVYTGDFWHACLAHLSKLRTLVSSGVFSGIDYSTHGGASEFFLRPNLYPYHPFALLAVLLLRPSTPESLIRVSVLLLVLHSFLGCYFTLRLARRCLGLELPAAAFLAIGYAFSLQMVNGLVYPPYIFCASMMPWAIYATLRTVERPSWLRVIIGSVPVFVMLTGGYVALGVSCVVMAFSFVVVYLFYVNRNDAAASEWRRSLPLAVAPFATAGFVAAPLYLAIVRFHQSVPTASTSVFWSAYQLAEMPRSVLRLLSSHLYYQAPYYEFSLYWGIVPIVIGFTFFAGLKDHTDLTVGEWRLLKFSAVVYALIALSIYGDFSAASNLLFAVPGIGKMHIYQRHLLAGHFFFMIAATLMLKAVSRRPVGHVKRFTFFGIFAVMAVSAHVLATNSTQAQSWRLNDYLVFELLLGVLFAAAQMMPGPHIVFVAATFLMLLTPLDHVQDYSTGREWSYPKQKGEHLVLDAASNQALAGYFRRNSDKAITKYVDITPGLREYLSKNYPWFAPRGVVLSSYSGYEMQLAAKASYLQRMVTTIPPGEDTWVVRPDWSWVARTGGQFVIYQEGDRLMDAQARAFIDDRDPAKVLHLPKGIVVAPLKFDKMSPSFNAQSVSGRHVRVQLGGRGILSLAEVKIRTAGGQLLDLSRKSVRQSSTFGGPSGSVASRAVDGNVNGDWSRKSVTHTLEEASPWWEVDLGSTETISAVEIWNRTDCCEERLRDYWVFVSDKAFEPTDSPAALSTRTGVVFSRQRAAPDPVAVVAPEGAAATAGGRVVFDNGYVRALSERATVTNFSSDGASTMTLDVAAERPATVEYLFWPNERLKFYVDNREVGPRIERGLQAVDVSAGRHRLDIRYSNRPLSLFLWLYALYGGVVIFAGIQAARVGIARFRGPLSELRTRAHRFWR